jgi:hypothetical protein
VKSPSGKRRNARLRDFALYILIALTIGLGAIWSADRFEGITHEAFLRWGGLGINTLLLFGVAIWNHRHLASRFRFWTVIGALLVAHLCFFVFLLFRTVEHWTLFWFVIAYPCEIVAFDAAIDACGLDRGHKRHSILL